MPDFIAFGGNWLTSLIGTGGWDLQPFCYLQEVVESKWSFGKSYQMSALGRGMMQRGEGEYTRYS